VNEQNAMPGQQYSQANPEYNIQNPVLSGITCETLTIGTWRRIATTPTDLLVYYSAAQRLFTYFISNNNAGFKMEFSFAAITSIEFRQVDEAYGEVTVDVRNAPQFYMECANGWQMCRDFTEGKQATHSLRHVIKGRAQALKNQIMELMQVDIQVGRLVKMMDFKTEQQQQLVAPHQTHIRRRSSLSDISNIMQGYRFGEDTTEHDDMKPSNRHVTRQLGDRPRRCSSVPATPYVAPVYDDSPVLTVSPASTVANSPLSINTSTTFLDMFKNSLTTDTASEFSCSSPMDVNTPESGLDMLDTVDIMNQSPMLGPDTYTHHMAMLSEDQPFTSMGISPSSLTVSALPNVTDDEFASMFNGAGSNSTSTMDGSEFLNFGDVSTTTSAPMSYGIVSMGMDL
jgi:hypothetical protein